MELVALIAGLVSIALAVFAAGVSLFVLGRASDADRRTSQALSKINAHSEVLQQITGSHMSALIDRATAPHPDLGRVLDLMREFSSSKAQHFSPTIDADQPTAEQQLLSYIVLTGLWDAVGQYICADSVADNTKEDREFLIIAMRDIQMIQNYFVEHCLQHLQDSDRSGWLELATKFIPMIEREHESLVSLPPPESAPESE